MSRKTYAILWVGLTVVVGLSCSVDNSAKRPVERSSVQGPISTVDEDLRQATVLLRDPTGCTWVDVSASVPFGHYDTKHQARAQATLEARGLAVEQVLGVRIQRQFLNFQAESTLKGQVSLTENLLRLTQFGRVVKEEHLESWLIDTPGCRGCRFATHLQVCVLPFSETDDKEFMVTLDLNRTRFVEGDEGVITVTASRDAYVYLFSVDLDWNASLLFPNDFAGENGIKAGQPFTYPSADLRQKGLKVKAKLPSGATVSAEMIRVLISKTPLPLSIFDSTIGDRREAGAVVVGEKQGGGSFLTLLHQLQLSRVQWVEDAQAFTIYKN